MINAKDIKNFYREVDQKSSVDLVKYFNTKLPELRMIVGNMSENYETYTELAMPYYYITTICDFVKERIKDIEECERDWFSCQYLVLKVLHNQLGLLRNKIERNFNVS